MGKRSGGLRVGLKLITPVREIQKNILTAAVRHLNLRLGGLSSKITTHARSLIKIALNASPVTIALTTGELRGEMGIIDATSELRQIFDAISQTVNVTSFPARITGPNMNMKIRLTAVPFDLSSIVGGAGSYTTEKGASIPWFQWLTTTGDRIIVRDYDVEGGHPNESRTGDMIMKKGKKGWRVPPEFAGAPHNNFVTQAADSILSELGNYIQSTAKSML